MCLTNFVCRAKKKTFNFETNKKKKVIGPAKYTVLQNSSVKNFKEHKKDIAPTKCNSSVEFFYKKKILK